MKTAVVYYSLEGNTKMVAEKIASKFDAKLYELKEIKNSVSKEGFFKYFWGGKQVVTKKKPKLEPLDFDVNDYDIIFIGTPVWAYSYAPAIRTFLANYNIKNKKVGLFCSHGGGPGNIMHKMENELIGNEIISKFDIMEPLNDLESSTKKIDKWLENIVKEV